MSATVMLSLPFPCSVNTMFPDRGGKRVPSPKYRAWRDEAGWRIKMQHAARIPGYVTVRIALVAPDRRRRDLDNYAKGVLDSLVTHGVIDDDSSIRRLSLDWEDAGEPCLVTITSLAKTNPQNPEEMTDE
jgi:crossover junction endodeoxyribonuclease RusA